MANETNSVLNFKDKKGVNHVIYPATKIENVAGLSDALDAKANTDTVSALSEAVSAKADASALATKVDKISGKTLSTNDYTTAEKNKLAGIAEGANKTVVDTALSSTSGNPIANSAVNTALSAKADATALANKVDKVSGKGLSTNDYTTTEKNKLAGIAEGANKTTTDAALSSTSGNPVANKAVYSALSAKADAAALANKVDKVSGKTLSTNDYTTTEKNKLAGIAEGANKTITDTSLDSVSSNPVSNSAVTNAVSSLSSAVSSQGTSISNLNTGLTTANARIDSFTALKAGSTTGDAELTDGRIAFDGQTYSNIGGAIRGQVSELKNDIARTTRAATHKLDKVGLVCSMYNSYNPDGKVTASNADFQYGTINLKRGQTIRVTAYVSRGGYSISQFALDGTFEKGICIGDCVNYEYTADKDCIIYVSHQKTSSVQYSVETFYKKNHEITEFTGIKASEIGLKHGSWYWTGAEYKDDNNSQYKTAYVTHPIYVEAHTNITVFAKAITNTYCIYFESLDRKNHQKIAGKGTGAVSEHSLTVKWDGYVYISCEKDDSSVVSISQTDTVSLKYDVTNENASNKVLTPSITNVDASEFGYSGTAILITLPKDDEWYLQIAYLHKFDTAITRLIKHDGTLYNSRKGWHPLGSYQYDSFPNKTSLDEFVEPYEGAVMNTQVTDLPDNRNVFLTVAIHNYDYVVQTAYQYSTGRTLRRMVKKDGTPYNVWHDISPTAANTSIISGKKIVGIGDSLMRANTLSISKSWLNLLGSKYGATVYNHGVNGNSIAVQMIETGNKPMVNRIDDVHTAVPEADYFVLIGGANDKRLNVPIGTIDSTDTSTFMGALNVLISKVREYYPKAHVVFMTNFDRYPSLNNIGKTDIDYVEAMIEVCSKRHVFCYDNYHNSGVDFSDDNFIAWADEGIYNGGTKNCHFSPAANEWLATKYKSILEAN